MKRNVVVAALGTTQNLVWGSSYYLPAIVPWQAAQFCSYTVAPHSISG